MNVVEQSRFIRRSGWRFMSAGSLAFALAASPLLAQAPAAGAGPVAPAQTTAPVAGRSPAGTNPSQTSTRTNAADRTDRTDRTDRNKDEVDRRDPTPGIIQEVPTEFQRLVAESIGTPLPIFGASLFGNVPSTFAPVDNIPVTPDYMIGPGDELRVQVYGQVNQEGSYTVDRTGDIAFPNVGTLHVAGVRYSDLSAFLKSQLSRVYRNFDLNVNMGQLRSIQIFVVGEARRPGAYTVSSLSTLINALFVSGGPLPLGSLRDIQIKRGGDTIVHFDLYDLLMHGDKSKDVPLAPGDVIFIPKVGPQVAIAGSVNNPAIYEIAPGTTLSKLIMVAGGQTSVALGTQVRLERIFEHSARTIIDVNTIRDKDPLLADGDIVSVGAILNRYNNAVTLRGNVTTPGRYVWHAGMHITDLVTSRDQLITREYYRRRNALGNTTADYGGQNVNGQASDGKNEGALAARGDTAGQATDQAVISGNSTTSVKGGGSVGDALTSSNSVFAATTDVILSAPDFDWNYAVIERLDTRTLTTSLIPFNPGALYLRNDASQNLELFSGDVVTFFSTADLKVPSSQQTRYVRLEGEFVAAGVYSVEPGETLRHLLSRSGGFTQDAYLYGSEFTRQSTRRVQQQRLNEYADSLEAQVTVLAANNNARAINDRAAAAANANAADSRTAIARLRRIVPTGRIVLQLKPDSRTIAEIPDLPLEDGDRFVVPRVPSTVAVEGQVYSANSFVFERGRREHDYLRQAGGPDREADRKRTFILRADGSVFSRQYGDVDRATIFPGDTIVVPPQLEHQAILRNLVDIATIISGFSLGAAALYVLSK